jgi:hypothetical protein
VSQAAALAAELRSVAGDTVRAVVLYGSHLLRTSPDRHSAADLVVIVEDYRAFFAALARARQLHRPVFLMTALAKVLPPSVLAFAPRDDELGIAKYLLISREDFARAMGGDPTDHFMIARMVQRTSILWTADEATAEWLDQRFEQARHGVLRWVAPYLDEPVDAERLGRRMLEVCYAGELRPESTARASRIFEAQVGHFRAMFTPVLEAGAAAGILRRVDGRYEVAHPVTRGQRLRIRWYFRRSKARATARWLKHTVTFINWLPYIQKKVERHTGRSIELTRLERKLPIVFLWPRVIHVLLTRPRREIGS